VAYTKQIDAPVTSQYWSVNWDGSNSTARQTVPFTRDRSGSAVPRFRAAIKSGLPATSAFDATFLNQVDMKPFIGRITHKEVSPGKTLYPEAVYGTFIDTLPAFQNQVTAGTDAKALARFYKNLDEAQSHAQGMQFLGEFHEVISQLKRPYHSAVQLVGTHLDRAAHAALKYRPRNNYGMKEALANLNKALADSWLETVFGLRPLVSDTKAIAEAIARHSLDTRRDKIVGSAGETIAGSISSSTQLANGVSYINIRKDVRETLVHKSRYVGFMDWSRSAALGSNSRLTELLGFRADKFIPTIYELIPYSWLADYVSNLGAVIESGCTSTASVKFGVYTSQVISTKEYIWTPGSTGALPVINSLIVPGSGKLIRKRVRRLGFTQVPTVPFSFSLPGEPMKYLNVLALWRSKATKIKNDWFTAPHRDVF
jgi:hypothetical protein